MQSPERGGGIFRFALRRFPAGTGMMRISSSLRPGWSSRKKEQGRSSLVWHFFAFLTPFSDIFSGFVFLPLSGRILRNCSFNSGRVCVIMNSNLRFEPVRFSKERDAVKKTVLPDPTGAADGFLRNACKGVTASARFAFAFFDGYKKAKLRLAGK